MVNQDLLLNLKIQKTLPSLCIHFSNKKQNSSFFCVDQQVFSVFFLLLIKAGESCFQILSNICYGKFPYTYILFDNFVEAALKKPNYRFKSDENCKFSLSASNHGRGRQENFPQSNFHVFNKKGGNKCLLFISVT